MEQEIQNPSMAQQAGTEDMLGIKDIWMLCLGRWQWFVYSLILCLGLAVAYLLRTPPTYTRSASLLIKEDAKGRAKSFSDQLDTVSDMGRGKSSSSVDNELVAF